MKSLNIQVKFYQQSVELRTEKYYFSFPFFKKKTHQYLLFSPPPHFVYASNQTQALKYAGQVHYH